MSDTRQLAGLEWDLDGNGNPTRCNPDGDSISVLWLENKRYMGQLLFAGSSETVCTSEFADENDAAEDLIRLVSIEAEKMLGLVGKGKPKGSRGAKS